MCDVYIFFFRIAISGTNRRIHIMNLSNLTAENMKFVSYTNSIQSKIHYLSWHPEAENLLAFSTDEGRVI